VAVGDTGERGVLGLQCLRLGRAEAGSADPAACVLADYCFAWLLRFGMLVHSRLLGLGAGGSAPGRVGWNGGGQFGQGFGCQGWDDAVE